MAEYEYRRPWNPALIPEGDVQSGRGRSATLPGAPGDYERAAPHNALALGIVSTANALGMDPVDLATIISYETAGTFDPTKAGPTTQWGQHRGLIQWGEPQARQYGVDWSDPIGSQLGPDGAIVRYFRNAGWQPGMGMLDAYSAVNAGRVGRYNASDANNGGAPGTVRDKVEQQMGAHRAKAEALLSDYGAGYYTPASEGIDAQGNALNAFTQQMPERTMPAFPQIGSYLDPAAFQAPVTNALAAPQFTISPLSTRFR
ncbi:hypothetical protein NM680_12980 [Paracoccus sp. PS-1]|uniref:hypothetical protein n=1 Tax=Paracoccus sp. PS1 TaxID=2963938 RepID=UPI0027E4F895|nr:hypothetical protein [Paracoccus sp. PS1]MDQ7262706.1 hypothetical protein [Paracoccus sp. PS1]